MSFAGRDRSTRDQVCKEYVCCQKVQGPDRRDLDVAGVISRHIVPLGLPKAVRE